jgi:DNA-binding MarR family transcriptional regulator
VRRLARLSTRFYDDALRQVGIEVGQFSLLASLMRGQGASQGDLSAGLGIESSSLTRNLAVLQARGWVEKESGADRRRRLLRLTPAGREHFKRALPAWKRAQERFVAIVGADHARDLARLIEGASVALNAEHATTAASSDIRRDSRPRRPRRRGV